MDEEKIYQVALSMVPGIGDITIKTLVSYCGSAGEVFKKTKYQLSKIPGMGMIQAGKIKSFNNFHTAEQEVKKCEDHDIEILFVADAKYPRKLKHAPDSPSVLFYKGTADLNNPKSVAIVGTRRSTSYGREFTVKLIEQLAPHNPLIVSGLAYGIDIMAHRSALKNNLETIGIMASGLDIIYPGQHRKTASQMLQQGGLLTEFPIGTIPDAHNFPSRNRVIAGMCDVIVVIEAAEKGGALITAEIANSYSRDVFALPGDISNKFSRGCNNLIKQNKAHLLTSAKDIEYIMNWETKAAPKQNEEKYYDYSKLSEDEKNLIETIKSSTGGLVIDELSWKSNIPLNKLASLLLNLEFNGIIKCLPGKKYKLK